MRLVDLPRTSSFRLALVFLGLFALASVAQFTLLYVRTQDFLVDHVDDWLGRERAGLSQTPPGALVERFNARLAAQSGLETIVVLYDEAGVRLAGDHFALPAPIATFDKPFDFLAGPDGHAIRFRGIADRVAGGGIVLIAQNMSETREFSEAFVATAFWGVAMTVGFGLAGALIIGIGTVRRFDRVALAIHDIVGGDLSRRLPVLGTTGDIDRLTRVVNSMLDDIERLMQEVKGVCDDVAHDLRTPLTRMLAGLERARRRSADTGAYEEAIDNAVTELRGVLKTFTALLRISEVEDGARRAGFTAVDLGLVGADVVEFYEPLAEELGLSLELAPMGGATTVTGDADLLFEAVGNLVDNAIKFTPRGGRVRVAIKATETGIGLVVEDTGCGIAEVERTTVLRRFHRSATSRSAPGHGLGLSLVAAVARLHGMALTIEDAAPGCRVRLHFAPISPIDVLPHRRFVESSRMSIDGTSDSTQT